MKNKNFGGCILILERKIYTRIKQFYNENPHKALMITGARQVGKSFIIEKYAKDNWLFGGVGG